MKTMAKMAVLAILGAGCADDPHPPEPEPPEPEQPEPEQPEPEPGPTIVTIRTTAPPAMLAFRHETSATWQAIEVAGRSTFEIATTGPYRVALGCESEGYVEVVELARTPADRPLIERWCGDGDVYPFMARGQVTESGIVYLGDAGRGASIEPWDLKIPAAAGTFDLVMLFGDLTAKMERIAIRRNVEVTGDLELGTIDPAMEHTVALVPVPFTASNLAADEELSVATRLQTAHANAALQTNFGTDDVGMFAPEDFLASTDHQSVTITGTTTTTEDAPTRSSYRRVRRSFRAGDATEVALPDAMGPVAFEMTDDRLAVTWSQVREGDELSLWRVSDASDFSRSWYHELRLSARFVAVTGATTATLDVSSVPGIRPAWRPDPGSTTSRGLTSSTEGATDWTLTSVVDGFQATQPAPSARPAISSSVRRAK